MSPGRPDDYRVPARIAIAGEPLGQIAVELPSASVSPSDKMQAIYEKTVSNIYLLDILLFSLGQPISGYLQFQGEYDVEFWSSPKRFHHGGGDRYNQI